MSTDRFHDQAIEAWDAEGPGRRRKLRAGELVSVPSLGLPDAVLTGRDVEVVEHPDGSLSPILFNPAGLHRRIAQQLVLQIGHPLSGAEAGFLRRFMGLSQQQMAEILEVRRETLSRQEQQAAFPARYADRYRLHAMRALFSRSLKPRDATDESALVLMEDSPRYGSPAASDPLRISLDDKRDIALVLATR